ELLEVGELADVDLRGEMTPDRFLVRLVRSKLAAGQRPAAGAGLERALPEEHLQAVVAHLEDDGENGVGVHSGHRLSTWRRKPGSAEIVVVGGGVAGLYAAICAAEEAEVLVLAKGTSADSNSWQAQGGVAAAVADDDAPALHAEDTFRAGRGLCRESAVGTLTEEAPARIAEIVVLGVEFASDLGREGGH